MNGRYTFYRTLIVVGTLFFLYTLYLLREVIIVLLLAIIVASAIRPIVLKLEQRGVPLWAGILGVYLGVAGAITLVFALAIPPLIQVVTDLFQDQGVLAWGQTQLYGLAQRVGYSGIEAADLVFQEIPQRVTGMVATAQEELTTQGPQLVRIGQLVVGGLASFFLSIVMAFYWLTSRDTILEFFMKITPIRHRLKAETVFLDVEHTLGDYVRGTALLMGSIGLSAFIGLMILGVPNALALAVIAGLFEAIPMVGATLGALPAVLIAFTVSPTVGLLAVALFVVIQFLENNVLVPRIMADTVGLNPLLVLLAIVAGGIINGVLGALLAVPVAGTLQVLARHLVVEPMVDEASQSHTEHGIRVFDLDEKKAPPKGDEKKGGNGDILIAES